MNRKQIEDRLIAVMGNQTLDSVQKSWSMLDIIRQPDIDPDLYPEFIYLILKSYGLAPRHSTKHPAIEIDEELIDVIEKNARHRVNHELKGWFEIYISLPVEKITAKICSFLEEWTDDKERAVIFEMILSSQYVPVSANHFSRFIDDEGDELILRKHAGVFIQLRQALNLNVGPTTRGSLIEEFLQPLQDDPHAKSILLGALVEELLRRLKDQSSSQPDLSQAHTMSFPIDMDPENMEEMMGKFQSMLPPEVLEQLRKLFFKEDDDDDSYK